MSNVAPNKPEFGPESLKALVSRINEHFPEELHKDWKAFVRAEFHLSPDQEKSLSHVPQHLASEIQEYFVKSAEYVKQKSAFRAKIVKMPKEKQTAAAVHELHLDIDSPTMTAQLSIVVAHCDAHCRNWGWGAG